MCWNSNANSIRKKILSGIYSLKRIKEYVDEKTLVSVSVYNGNAISQPYFSSCCEFNWNTFGETQSTCLQKLHNRAVYASVYDSFLRSMPRLLELAYKFSRIITKSMHYEQKMAISKTRNTGTPEHRNTEHRNTKKRNTGTPEHLN